MIVNSVSDWVLLAAGLILAGAALLFMVASLFRDRSRGRDRCPRCWYSLEGVPRDQSEAATCPECGRPAISPRQMRRTHRRWFRAALGLVVIVLGVALASVPAVRAKGWPGVVPMTALVYLAPVKEGPNSVSFVTRPVPGGTVLFSGPGAAGSTITIRPGGPLAFGAAPVVTVSQRLEGEAWARVSNGEAWSWQADVLVRRWLKACRLVPHDLFAVPARWPEGQAVPLYFRPPTGSLFGGQIELSLVGDVHIGWDRDTRLALIPARSRDRHWVQPKAWFTVGKSSVSLGMLRMPCESVARDRMLDRIDDETANAHVASLLNPRFGLQGNAKRPVVIIGDRGSSAEWLATDYGIAFKVAVVIDGKEVAHGWGEVNWDYPVWKEWQEVGVSWEPGALERVLAEPGAAKLLVTGRYEASVESYMNWPFPKSHPAAWTGRFEKPLTVEDLSDIK